MEVLQTFRTEQNRLDKVAELQLLKTSLERQLAGARNDEVSPYFTSISFYNSCKTLLPHITHICDPLWLKKVKCIVDEKSKK